MAADIQGMLKKLGEFYDFSGKVVLLVGAGGGQLLQGVRSARKIIAIDQDEGALKAMEAVAISLGIQGRVECLHAAWEDVTVQGDVVYFEFCLHEMADPGRALAHARTLAPEVLIFDHAAESEWAQCTGEGEIVRRSAEVVAGSGIKRRAAWQGMQSYKDYAELWGRVSRDPRTREEGLSAYRGRRDLEIPMPCSLALV